MNLLASWVLPVQVNQRFEYFIHIRQTNRWTYPNQSKDVTTLKGNQLADFRANEIGFIFQDFNLLESLTAQENIAVPLSLQGVRPKEIKQRVQNCRTFIDCSYFGKLSF